MTAPIRTAVIAGADSARQVAAYLPDNYEVTDFLTDDRGRLLVQIAGKDSSGWTLDDYVLPRLASGLMFGTETTR